MKDKKNKKHRDSLKDTDSLINKRINKRKSRRILIKSILGIGACVATGSNLLAATSSNTESIESDDPVLLPPQEGDYLVNAEGDNQGKPVSIYTLEVNKKYIKAWPMDSEKGVIRNGSRFNKLLVIKLNPEELDDKTKAFSQNGIIVYSGICTHQGCDISAWVEDKKNFFCYCHYSRFDPRKFGKVTYGPAKKKLPLLPIELDEALIKVAGNFTRKPGGSKR